MQDTPDAPATPGPHAGPETGPETGPGQPGFDAGALSAEDIALIADRVGQVLQLDRMRHHVSSAPDLAAQANIPAYLARIFEAAGAVDPPISNEALYDLVNKRIARVEAMLYLMRVEAENRSARDPAQIFADPMLVSAYNERVAGLTAQPRRFSFEPTLLADGWHGLEQTETGYHRWMRPTEAGSLICLPHLGEIDQVIEIEGRVLHPDQIAGLSVRMAEIAAKIACPPEDPTRFVARLALPATALARSTYVSVTCTMTDFRQPNETDTRALGADIQAFTCRPATAEPEEAAAP